MLRSKVVGEAVWLLHEKLGQLHCLPIYVYLTWCSRLEELPEITQLSHQRLKWQCSVNGTYRHLRWIRQTLPYLNRVNKIQGVHEFCARFVQGASC